MKKKLIVSAVVLCSLLALVWIVGRVTGMLLFFSIPTPSNLPNIKPGDKVYSSNLKDPDLYNFIVFTSESADSISMIGRSDLNAGAQYLYRLCGVPGNTIEMRNGILYVNSKNFDEKINLNNQYMISSAESDLIDQTDMHAMETSGGAYMISKDFTLVTFDSILIKKYSSKLKPAPYIMAHAENGPFKWNNKDEQWTTDNFGPLKIPTGCYFVLGDNRHNALDSRYIGFVKKEDIKGVVLNK
jgi:signal peptidase I